MPSVAPCMRPQETTGGRSGVRGVRSWIACCLSRGTAAPLNRSDIEELATEMGERQVAGGTFVFRHGDHAARVHVVRSGAIDLSKIVGGRRVTLQRLRPGDVFGDVPALLGREEPFDARAVDDSTVLSIEAAALFELLQTRPGVARRWFVSMAERMAGLQDRLDDLLAGSLESQLASLIVREAGNSGEVRVTHAHLAELLGTQRSSVQRVLKSLESAGLIELRYRRIELVDRGALEALIDRGIDSRIDLVAGSGST
jgi:CRP-like cAMP-binding protein